MRPADMVEVVCTNNAYTSINIESVHMNLLQGTVTARIGYTKTTTRWYKTEEDAEKGRNGYSYNEGEYVIERPYQVTSNTDETFSLSEWNSGKVVWRR